jgi:hypothetical protein
MREDIARIVDAIYSRLQQNGDWPRVRELQLAFAELGNFRTWVAREASDEIVCPEGPDSRVSLSFEAIAQSATAAEDMAVAWAAVRLAGELAAEGDSSITQELVATKLDVHGAQLTRIGRILASERFVFSAGGASAGDMSSYSYVPSERALSFRQVHNLADYAAAKVALQQDERERGALQARKYQERMAMWVPSPDVSRRSELGPAIASARSYVSVERLTQLRELPPGRLDPARLIRMCEELNTVAAGQAHCATVMLVRAILDHVPPVFECTSFANVIGSIGTRSFKDTMRHLDESARKIADGHLHGHMRRREVLPTSTQVDFSQSLDVLLGEVCVHWSVATGDTRPPDVA